MSPEDLMATSVEHRDGVVVLKVEGEVDTITAPNLVAAIVAVLAEEPSAVVMDLSAVKFFASAGLQVLGQTAKKVRGRADFAVVASGPATLRPIRLTGLDSIFELYTTLDGALRGMSTTTE
jgi:anti-sigma B factor antagonist